jgi:hypothetical protein
VLLEREERRDRLAAAAATATAASAAPPATTATAPTSTGTDEGDSPCAARLGHFVGELADPGLARAERSLQSMMGTRALCAEYFGEPAESCDSERVLSVVRDFAAVFVRSTAARTAALQRERQVQRGAVRGVRCVGCGARGAVRGWCGAVRGVPCVLGVVQCAVRRQGLPALQRCMERPARALQRCMDRAGRSVDRSAAFLRMRLGGGGGAGAICRASSLSPLPLGVCRVPFDAPVAAVIPCRNQTTAASLLVCWRVVPSPAMC